MGSSRVKKPKKKQSQYITLKQYKLFGDTIADFAEVTTTKLKEIDSKLKSLEGQAIQDLSLIAESMGVYNKRLSAIESKVNKPIVFEETSKVSQDMINALKYSKYNFQPKCKAHNIVDHRINGVVCDFLRSQSTFVSQDPPFVPKVSQWKTNEERCKHTLRALKNAFRFMHSIKLHTGTTVIMAYVMCQKQPRKIILDITKNDIILSYYRRSGELVTEHYDNTTQAAAAMTAVCMYYATR